ncbi:MAG: PIG-L family deacetylase [Candidatus Wallbacteria bacterium]|nr:PIG-L family deacetylase [Candidatus Wallbacteria bacterium]
MKFHRPEADIFVPDGTDAEQALSRTTHLCICAHQDDMEIFAFHGILECFNRKDYWFTGVVLTDGAGSARSGEYGQYSDQEMQKVRFREQRKAAQIGEYSALIQLLHPSSAVKDNNNRQVVEDLLEILKLAKPKVVYLHNPADKHDTHVATLSKAITALRSLSPGYLPDQVFGCEVWRNLDWVCDEDKVVLPVDGHQNLSAALLGVFDSQIAGGKRYDLATEGRRLSNATYFQSHETDTNTALTYALDLMPLLLDKNLKMSDFVSTQIRKFEQDARNRADKFN